MEHECGKISVIVPVYKVEPYIHQCIDSILCQTYDDLEIILVNDGSPDKCPDICDEYAKKDKRIKVLHKENGGLSDARNAGLKIASGAYIGFVDSDDWIAPNMYEELMRLMDETGADISACIHIYSKNGLLKEIGADGETVVFSREEALDQLFQDKIFKSHVWDKLYRREIFDGIAFPKGRSYEDIYVMHDLIAKADKVTLLKKGMYYYRIRDNSIVRSKDIKNFMDRLYCLDHRFSSVYAEGRREAAPHQILSAAELAKRLLCDSDMSPVLKRKYNKQINHYIIQYCKGPTLSPKQHIIKWFLVFMPDLFYKKIVSK